MNPLEFGKEVGETEKGKGRHGTVNQAERKKETKQGSCPALTRFPLVRHVETVFLDST